MAKSITIRVPEEFHQRIKVKAAKENLSIKDYLLGLAAKDLASSKDEEIEIEEEEEPIVEERVIYNKFDMFDFLKSFDDHKLIEVKIGTPEDFQLVLPKPILKIEEGMCFSLESNGLSFGNVKLSEVRNLKISEEGQVAAAVVYGSYGTRITLLYENL